MLCKTCGNLTLAKTCCEGTPRSDASPKRMYNMLKGLEGSSGENNLSFAKKAVSNGWAKKNTRGGKVFYSLTSKGREMLKEFKANSGGSRSDASDPLAKAKAELKKLDGLHLNAFQKEKNAFKVADNADKLFKEAKRDLVKLEKAKDKAWSVHAAAEDESWKTKQAAEKQRKVFESLGGNRKGR